MSDADLVRVAIYLPREKREELRSAAVEDGISSADFVRRSLYRTLRERRWGLGSATSQPSPMRLHP